MKKLLLLALFLSPSIFSMDDRTPKLLSTAKAYNELVDASFTYSTWSDDNKRVYSDLGFIVTPEEVDTHFFKIDLTIYKFLPVEIRAFYDTLLAHNIIREIDYLYSYQLIRDRNPPRAFLHLKSILTDLYSNRANVLHADDKLHVFRNPELEKNIFHAGDVGFFMRHKNKLSSVKGINRDIKNLFLEDNDAKLLLNGLSKMLTVIKEHVTTIHKTLQSNKNFKTVVRNLRKTEKAPTIWLQKIEALRVRNKSDKQKQDKILKNIILATSMVNTVLDNRINAIKKVIHPAPYDVFLLYGFFLFEEAKIYGVTDEGYSVIDLLNSFGDTEELSIVAHLAPYAHHVMEQLGIDPSSHRKQKEANTTELVIASEESAALDETQTELPINSFQDKHEDKDKAEPISNSNVENAREKRTAAKAKPKKVVMLNSLADEYSPNNIKLRLNKEHRLLDTIARRIGSELEIGLGQSPGSVSIAVIRENDVDKFMIATKFNRSEAEVIEALKNIVKFSINLNESNRSKLFLTEKRKEANEIMEAIKNHEVDTKTEGRRHKRARESVDKITIYNLLTSTVLPHNQNIIKKILLAVSEKNIRVLENPFDMHSEVVLVTHLLEERLAYGFITHNQKKIPYQYIGGSILTCAKCDALFRGGNGVIGLNDKSNQSNMAIFTRGHSELSYGGYYIPRWVLDINNQPVRKLQYTLDDLCRRVGTVSFHDRISKQTTEMSDSDDDLPF